MADARPERRILLVDCDAFFVQVARLVDPEGAGRARLLIVGGSPTGRGVVTSASYEARAFGVRSAMPTGRALELCPDALVVGVSRTAVMEKSREVRATLEELAPVVQAASVDEFYLDLTGTERIFAGESLEATARRIQGAVLERTRIAVSIGGGTRRMIAKLASARAKPAGVHVVPQGGEQAFLDTLELADLPGVGPALADELRRRGLVRVSEARSVQREWLDRWLGKHRGAWLHRRIHGADDREVEAHEQRRSISAERTFFQDLTRDEELDRRLMELVASVASALRGKGLRARTVGLKLRDHDFRTRSKSRSLPEPVESDAVILDVGRQLLRDLRKDRRVPARLLGVQLSSLTSREGTRQLGLFDMPIAGETERDRSVSRLVDTIRTRFGREKIKPGRLLEESDE